jgi:starch synthase
MKILIATSELAPFAGSDAFGGSVAAMATELQARGNEVSVALPYYRSVRELGASKSKKTGVKFSVPLGNGRYSCEIREGRASGGVQVFFVDRDEFFDRSGLYGVDDRDYQDNAARFTFFSKAVIELVRRMEPSPEVIHACNWQSALVPVLAAEAKLGIPTVLGAQSLEFQGNFWSYDFGLTNLPGSYFSARGLEYYGSMNMLKGGILLADSVILPGPRFVSEVQTPVSGCGLESVMRENAAKLEGVTPGMAVAEWNPATDKALTKRFKSADSRAVSRRAEWQKLGFANASQGPALLLPTAAMLSDGLTLALAAFDRLVEGGAQLLILGAEHPEQTEAIEFAARKHRGAIVRVSDPDDGILRRAMASADAIVLPSAVRPDAKVLLQAMRYGAVPVAMACGGIHQVVPPIDKNGAEGIGFFFYEPSVDALISAVRAMDAARQSTTVWNAIVSRAMRLDSSWAASAASLEGVYASLVARKKQRPAA